MGLTFDLDNIAALSIQERIELAQVILDSIVEDQDADSFELTDAQKQELDRRLASAAASPEKLVPWEEVKAKALERAKAKQ